MPECCTRFHAVVHHPIKKSLPSSYEVITSSSLHIYGFHIVDFTAQISLRLTSKLMHLRAATSRARWMDGSTFACINYSRGCHNCVFGKKGDEDYLSRAPGKSSRVDSQECQGVR